MEEKQSASAEEEAAAEKPASAPEGATADKQEEEIGKITHYFGKIGVGVVEIAKGTLKAGDTIHIKGGSTDFEQTVDSLQVEHENVDEVKEGDAAGMKVSEKVHEGDVVYKVIS